MRGDKAPLCYALQAAVNKTDTPQWPIPRRFEICKSEKMNLFNCIAVETSCLKGNYIALQISNAKFRLNSMKNNIIKPNSPLLLRSPLLDYIILFILSFLAIKQIILGYTWPDSHDGPRYLCLFDQFRDAFMHGILYPRWLPDYYGGYGYPSFVFYQPGLFYLILLVSLIFQNILLSFHITLLLFFFIGTLGVYKLARELLKTDSVSAIFCSILFLFTPYIYVNLYVRGDLSELASMFICPWPFLMLIKLMKKVENNKNTDLVVLGLSFFLFALIITHPFTAFFYFPCFLITGVYLALEIKNRKNFLFQVFWSLAIAVVLSAPYWFTVFQMKEYVNYTYALGTSYKVEENAVNFYQLFSKYWGFGSSVPGPDDGMSFQLGLPHFILALAGFITFRRNRLIQISFVFYIILIFFMTNASLLFWEHVKVLKFIQFPWRLLSVIAILQIICISGLIDFIKKSSFGKFKNIIFAAILVLIYFWSSNQFEMKKSNCDDINELIEKQRNYRLNILQVYESANEFLPKTVTFKPAMPRLDRPMLQVDHTDCTIEEYPDSTHYKMDYRITSKKPLRLLINQFYFPGWKVILDDKRIEDSKLKEKLLKDGRMEIEISAGETHFLTAYYDGPPGWATRNLAIVVLLAALIFGRRCYLSRFQNLQTAP